MRVRPFNDLQDNKSDVEKNSGIHSVLQWTEETVASMQTMRALGEPLRKRAESHQQATFGDKTPEISCRGKENALPGHQDAQRPEGPSPRIHQEVESKICAEATNAASPDRQNLLNKNSLQYLGNEVEAQESHKRLLCTSSDKVFTDRVAALEQAAHQQTEAFQEMCNKNATLRLELQLAEKKLAIRSERIENLKKGLVEEKQRLKVVQDQFAGEADKFKAELVQAKVEVNYWKERSLRDRTNVLSHRNVVKVLKGGQKHVVPSSSVFEFLQGSRPAP